MSAHPANDPGCQSCDEADVETVIEGRPRDLGGFTVRRILPASERRTVGPFIFFDHMGPATLPAGEGIDVRPHPHINLATVTYLFDGEIVHRDNLGSNQPIRPGAINWMTAGKGIVHSERTGDDERARESTLHGIQAWVALPVDREETAPDFRHHPADSIPEVERDQIALRVLVGSAYGVESPVETLSPLVTVDATGPTGAVLELPDATELAAYVVDGMIRCGAQRAEPGSMLVLARDRDPTVELLMDSRIMLIGGEPLEGERHIWWNFVSSRRERIERAKDDWKSGRFGRITGDRERIPHPEE